MTIKEFFAFWNGKYCEVAGSPEAKNQCVDLANAYIRDVLKLPIIQWTNAINFPVKAGKNFTFIQNTPDAVPQLGDVVIWGQMPGNPYGHIAVATGEGDTNGFKSFDQNYPLNTPCHFQRHSYNYVLGWLRPLVRPVTQNPNNPTEDVRNSEEVSDMITDKSTFDFGDGLGVLEMQAVRSMLNDNKRDLVTMATKIDELNESLKRNNDAIADWSERLNNIEKERDELKEQLKDKLSVINILTEQNEGLTQTITEWKEHSIDCEEKMADAVMKKFDKQELRKLILAVIKRLFRKG